jgi:hypothetical protein
MKLRRAFLADSILPMALFSATVAAHYLWVSRPPTTPIVDSPWATLPSEASSAFSLYLESGGYWLAYSYGLSLAFAAVAIRRFIRRRTVAGGGFALGGVTFSGLLAFFGCYLTGCCGSPMLIVYLNLFGARFLPFAKPFVAAVTTISILGAWWWMTRVDRRRGCRPSSSCCC